jgi:hypothetical protein
MEEENELGPVLGNQFSAATGSDYVFKWLSYAGAY